MTDLWAATCGIPHWSCETALLTMLNLATVAEYGDATARRSVAYLVDRHCAFMRKPDTKTINYHSTRTFEPFGLPACLINSVELFACQTDSTAIPSTATIFGSLARSNLVATCTFTGEEIV